MKRSKIKEFFGYKYVANTRSHQIHSVTNLQESCHFLSLKNGFYVTLKKALSLIQQGDEEGEKYDGCRHCWKQMNNYPKK